MCITLLEPVGLNSHNVAQAMGMAVGHGLEQGLTILTMYPAEPKSHSRGTDVAGICHVYFTMVSF